jgi:hypothetical protein
LFELSDACQIKENKYILVVNYQSHTEYLKLDLSDNSYSKSSTNPDIEERESPKLSNSTFNKLDILKPFLALVFV